MMIMESTLGIGQAARLLGPRSRRYSAGSAKEDWFDATRGLAGVEYVEEVGGDMDFRRERFFVLMDAMTIVYFFSSRLHGLRNYRRQLCAELEGGHAAGTSD